MNKSLSLALVIAAAAVFGFGYVFATFVFAPAKPGDKTPVVIEIHRGEAPSEIVHTLAQSGVITDPWKFSWLARVNRAWKRVKAGEYEVTAGMTPLQVIGVITSGISMGHPLTVREGENMYEIADAVEKMGFGTADAFLKLCTNPKFMATLGLTSPLPVSLEGYLFPETYFLTRTMSQPDIIKEMVHKAFSVWTDADLAQAKTLGMTRHQIIILASIVEKETGAPEERPMISGVFYNRLRKHMRLQSDPTTIYGIWDHYDGNIHKSDLMTPTPFNTYTVNALPAGPISNPGIEAIQAALHPIQTENLYFVSKNDGTHEFNETYERHNDAVRRLQLNPKAREGKSWRDLSKRQTATQ